MLITTRAKVSLSSSYIQSPLTSLRTYEVTNSRLVTHFRIPKIQKIKILVFSLLRKLGLLYIFYLKFSFFIANLPLYIFKLCIVMFLD